MKLTEEEQSLLNGPFWKKQRQQFWSKVVYPRLHSILGAGYIAANQQESKTVGYQFLPGHSMVTILGSICLIHRKGVRVKSTLGIIK